MAKTKVKARFLGEHFSDDQFEVILDRKSDEIIVNDKEAGVVVKGDYMVKNRHVGRLKHMIGIAKNLQFNRDTNDLTMDLADYSELNDPNFYVQKLYANSWSIENPMTEESILETKVGAGALSKYSEVFLKINGIIKEQEVKEKN